MIQVRSVNLDGKVPAFGDIRITAAEWWSGGPIILLRYAIDDELQPLGIRMDLDKRCLLDDLDDTVQSARMRAAAVQIWEAVVPEIRSAGYAR